MGIEPLRLEVDRLEDFTVAAAMGRLYPEAIPVDKRPSIFDAIYGYDGDDATD